MDKPVDHVFVVTAPEGESLRITITIEDPRLYQYEGDGMVYQKGQLKIYCDDKQIEEYKIGINEVKVKRGEE